MTNKKPDNPKSRRASKADKVYSNATQDQCTRLLHALRERSVTTLYARSDLEVLHLAGRVQELREQGHNIITHWKTEKTELGEHRVAEYVLLSGKYKGGRAA